MIDKLLKLGVMGLISIFFLIFGLGLFVAIVYTDSSRGQIVNMICGFFFILASVISYLVSRHDNKTKNIQ